MPDVMVLISTYLSWYFWAHIQLAGLAMMSRALLMAFAWLLSLQGIAGACAQ
jgi:hypothetical protein